MSQKKSSCKFQDYIESRPHPTGYPLICSPFSRSLAEFKLDRISPRNINIRFLPAEGIESEHRQLRSEKGLGLEHSSVREVKPTLKKSKIAHIFNIRSINLIDKLKYERERADIDKTRHRAKHSSKEPRKMLPTEKDKDSLQALNLILTDKKPTKEPLLERKNNSKIIENRSALQPKCDGFQMRLHEYRQFLREQASAQGLSLAEVEQYPRGSLLFNIGKGNNGALVRELLKKRWWWTATEDRTKRPPQFVWSQLKEKTFFQKIEENFLTHNHFESNQFLGNKKALFYNMKAHYEAQGKKVFDYLPVTFHIKRYGDPTWLEFEKYYMNDERAQDGERLWIVKPGENSNRGNGITVHSEWERLKSWVSGEIGGDNNPKKTLIVQKYISRPLLYHKRKFDIRCYMLLVRLNGKIRGYWYEQGYIRTSCCEFQLNDTANEFIHLTNDAVQVHSDKYGKYEDGNKLSYTHFQKYLDTLPRGTGANCPNFTQGILPQLKKIATDCIEASYRLLGEWKGLPTFEVFGLDFMIDESFKPWLIEINTNPCLETSSSTLERVIPRMVDHALRLSLDLLFPPPLNWPNSKRHYLPSRPSRNLFELIFSEEKKTHVPLHHDVIVEMGEIEEDNQIYEQTCKQATIGSDNE